MEGAFTFTCQLCRARLTLVGNLEAAESATWAGGRGFLVPPHMQASVFDQTNVDESFIVLDGKRQGLPGVGLPHTGLPPHPQHHPQHQHLLAQPQHQRLPSPHPQAALPQQHSPSQAHQAQQPDQQPGQQQQQPPQQTSQQLPLGAASHPQQPQPQLLVQQRGLEESFVVLGGAASVLRQNPGLLPHHLHQHCHPPPPLSGVSALHLQAQQQPQHRAGQAGGAEPGPGQGAAAAAQSPRQLPSPPAQTQQQQQQQPHPQVVAGQGQTPPPQMMSLPQPQQQLSPAQPQTPYHPGPYAPPHPHHPHTSPTQQQQQQPPLVGPRRGGGGSGPGGGEPEAAGYGSPGGSGSGGGGGGSAGSGLDSKLRALAQLFELASTNTQVDHPLCMDCVGQLKEEMETQIAEAEREIAAYSACLAQLEGGGAAAGGSGGGQQAPSAGPGPSSAPHGARSGPSPPAASASASASASPRREVAADAAEEYRWLEEMSRLEQERDQERARAEVLEAELAALVSELGSLAAASADLSSLEERYWHDTADFELLLRTHTEERGALLARIDRAGQRLQLLKNTSVLYDAFKIWHDGPFGTISGFRLGRTPELAVEWDEINAAWGQAVLLLHSMAQMSKLQFSQHRLLPMGSHPRVADKRATYDLFGPVSKLWSANYDRAMTAYLACLREFGEHARRKDVQDGKPTPFNFPFSIDGDKVNNHTIKLTLNKDVRWTKALKFMLANLKIALQWCVKQDQSQEVPQLAQLEQEGPQLLPEH